MVSPLLDRHLLEGRGGRIAIRTPAASLTYLELYHLTNRAGHALMSLGVEPEQRVALLLPDSPAFVATFLGAMKIGAVPVPLNTLAGPFDYEYFLDDSRAKVLVIGAEVFPKFEPIRARRPFLRHVIVQGGEAPGTLSFHSLTRDQPETLEPAETHRDDPAYWLYSSGTTGRPKGVVHCHRDMVSCVGAYATHVLSLRADDLLFSVPRLFFSYGLVNSLYLPLWGGASVLLCPERPDPVRVLQLIREHRPTIFFSVPTSYAAILKAIESGADHDLGPLRLAITAGEPLPPVILDRWRKLIGGEILDGIGSTEVGYIFISNRPGRVRPGSSGEVIPGYEVRVADEGGEELRPGEVGDLLVKSESFAAHYWHQREKTRETFLGQWLRTGDKYMKDGDGYYFYVGRADELFKVSGNWVSPLEVEHQLLTHPAVAECAVVAAEDEDGLIKPIAYVVLKHAAPSEDLARELQEFLKHRLPPFKAPRWISFVAELPKTATGKIQRYKLKEKVPA